nr:hypothetical protein [Tanacetum cinerariifolium]
MHKYTRFDAQSFKDAMICTMDSIGKYMLEIILHQQRTLHLLKQQKLIQTQEDHSNLIRALNVDSLKVNLVVIQNLCSETEDSNSETASSKSVKESSFDPVTKDVHAIKYKMSGNDTDADDVDIRPIYDEEPMAKVQLTAEYNILAIGQQHNEQPEIINEGMVDQYPEQRQVKSPMFDSSLDDLLNDYSKQSLESENCLLKQTVA